MKFSCGILKISILYYLAQVFDLKPDYLTSSPDYLTSSPDYLTSSPDYLTSSPDYLTSSPDYLTSSPDYLTSRDEKLGYQLKVILGVIFRSQIKESHRWTQLLN